MDPESFNHCFALVNGIRMHYVDQGTGPLAVLCVHGFPDLWYGWRFQIPFLVSLGYRVVVPDMRGYGQTDATHALSGYTAKSITHDLVALLDHLGISTAVWAGHDWGGMHVWRAALWHPERVLGVISFCTPFSETPKEGATLERFVQRFPMWSYQLYFRRFESVDALDREIPLFLTVLLRSHDEIVETSVMSPRVPVRERTIADARGTTRSSLLSANELAYYVQQYQRQGMLGPTNYYRVDELSAREEREAHIECVVRKPCMMVTVGNDHVLPAEWADGMEKRVPRLMRRHIESAGHWVLVEQKELANAALRAFLDEITSAEAKL